MICHPQSGWLQEASLREALNVGRPRRGHQRLAPGERSEPGVTMVIRISPERATENSFALPGLWAFDQLTGGSLRSPPANFCCPSGAELGFISMLLFQNEQLEIPPERQSLFVSHRQRRWFTLKELTKPWRAASGPTRILWENDGLPVFRVRGSRSPG